MIHVGVYIQGGKPSPRSSGQQELFPGALNHVIQGFRYLLDDVAIHPVPYIPAQAQLRMKILARVCKGNQAQARLVCPPLNEK